ncbi:MAG: complex I subunit 1 family protein [bacterium]
MENFINGFINNEFITAIIISIIPLIFVLVYALIAILGELKISAFMQERLGPMRTGPWGIFQPIAEVIKLLQKEDITPDAVNKPLFNFAPFLMFAASYACFAVIPFSSHFIPASLNLGLFYLLAVGSIGVISIVMGGWASNNKYSILGAMRSASQIVSYELPAGICLLTIAALTSTFTFSGLGVSKELMSAVGGTPNAFLGGLDIQHINVAQSGGFWNWFIFGGPGNITKIWVIPFTLGLTLIYFISSLAETNRTPFDISEGESEIVAGYFIEYSGIKFAMFYFAEYANMYVVAAIMTILFLGGWTSPFGDFMNGPIWGAFWFVSKAFAVVFLQIWVRWTLPRLRVDQLMNIGWKVLLPLSLVCFLVISLWGILH